MAHNKDEIMYGAAQAKLSEDEMLRVRYKHGTPLEGGKIADSEPVNLFVGAERVAEANRARPERDPNPATEQGGEQANRIVNRN